MEDDFGMFVLTSRKSDNAIGGADWSMEIIEAARADSAEKIFEHAGLGKGGLDIVIRVGQTIDAENLPDLVGGGARGA